MPQTVTSIAALGSRYLSGLQYRVLDTAGAYYPGPGDNLTNGAHLGQGIWRAVVTLPDAGGEVRWSQAGALLAVDVVEPVPGAIAGEAVAAAVWSYTDTDRSLTGTQASNLAAIPSIPTNPLLASNYTAPPSAATIADTVWDETLSQHLTAGSTGAKLNLASTLTVGDIPAGLSAQQVWEYATRTLSVASGLTNIQEIKLNELHRKAGLDPAAPVTRTLNPATGNVAETFTGATINHVETGTTVVTTRQQP